MSQGYSVDLYTYGQPRVGDENFANFLNQQTKNSIYLRAVYRNDPVPGMPFKQGMGYYHGGTEVFFFNCGHQYYILFPKNEDVFQPMDVTSVVDHEGYYCLSTEMEFFLTS
mmetsp:Transcript_36939/g.27308  ORF Transcript_36939/g.27308 Transcript_36939/m.27308 type:complete len:111 (+) Transcript_36939:671-1003(+)